MVFILFYSILLKTSMIILLLNKYRVSKTGFADP